MSVRLHILLSIRWYVQELFCCCFCRVSTLRLLTLWPENDIAAHGTTTVSILDYNYMNCGP
jgi:hypothetical protein